jgi:hypothetical protein
MNQKRAAVLLAAIFVTMVLVGILLTRGSKLTAFVLNTILLTLFLGVASKAITGNAFRLLVNQEKRMSLSQLQILGWTVLVVSALFTAGLGNVSHGSPNALDIRIPTELWLLLGVGSVSLVGSPLLKLGPRRRTLTPSEKGNATKTFNAAGRTNLDLQGILVCNRDWDDAGFRDLFEGEQVGNFGTLDVGKVQMLFFTAIALIVYGAALARMFTLADPFVSQFPLLHEGLLLLIGISHAGYLTFKAVPK